MALLWMYETKDLDELVDIDDVKEIQEKQHREKEEEIYVWAEGWEVAFKG